MQLNIENITDLHIPADDLRSIAQDLTSRDIDLVICDDDFIANLNMRHRRKDDPTDVLSFPIRNIKGDPDHMPLGSIVISIDKVKEAAIKHNHTIHNEMLLLFIHGILHLLGCDHDKDDGEMREKEIALIRKYNLPESLIVRAGE